ncbi:sigma-B regulation protein RsbU (phosphoserine phosphatase) [Desulfonatronum thiosulfatophilum]|uniref:Sigma-B regulation protein RsbU (Phosphoserine phosphatase) n=1 Tax=Desulfonatronum thiosulfatophilum TaxID=617002 RepID=A0A1G6AVY7_9BACT|nr:SpoIIE family protein phosphatase [Desulfonatronum thiosulfatophilum]SDB12504.1 sigma-B regulation protein RsbU (phosphoserine phosphatase) [Desulfonatronum thiosulfatophilum]
MFHSLKTKIFFLVCVILALVAVLVLYFTHRDVEEAMFDAEQRSARNVLELVELNIQSGYRDLLRSRMDAVNAHRRTLQGMTMMAHTGLDEIFAAAPPAEKAGQDAMQRALDWLSAPTFVEGTELLVFDLQGVLLAHPHKEARGSNLNQIQDIKGLPLARAVEEEVRRQGHASATFFWPWTDHAHPVKKFGWFVHYPLTDWIIGAAVDIEELEREGERKLEELINNLRVNFSKIRIAKSGSIALFNAQGEMLIQPAYEALNLEGAINELTGGLILEELKAAAQSRERASIRIVLRTEEDMQLREIEAFSGYFRTLGWYVAAMGFVDEISAPARDLVSRLSLIIAGVLLASLALGLLLAIRLTRPLNALTDYAKSMPETDFTSADPRSTAIDHLPRQNKDEVGRLAEALIFMDHSLRDNVRSLLETTALNERMETELSVAREIQLGLIPKTFPPYPERPEFDLYAVLEPAREVGGDLYDFFFIDEHHFCFAVGDVSDKGVPAALFMAVSRTLFRIAAVEELNPARIMETMNNNLAPNNPNSMFVTLFIGVLDVRTGELRYSNGGHNQPVIVDRDGKARFLEGRSGPMVGAMEDLPYSPLETNLAPDELLFLYTDGITEAMNIRKELYSDERLLATMETLPERDATAAIRHVQTDLALHVAEADQSDDITMLCIKFRGMAPPAA